MEKLLELRTRHESYRREILTRENNYYWLEILSALAVKGKYLIKNINAKTSVAAL